MYNVGYMDKHGVNVQIKHIRWLAWVKMGILNVYELMGFFFVYSYKYLQNRQLQKQYHREHGIT